MAFFALEKMIIDLPISTASRLAYEHFHSYAFWFHEWNWTDRVIDMSNQLHLYKHSSANRVKNKTNLYICEIVNCQRNEAYQSNPYWGAEMYAILSFSFSLTRSIFYSPSDVCLFAHGPSILIVEPIIFVFFFSSFK